MMDEIVLTINGNQCTEFYLSASSWVEYEFSRETLSPKEKGGDLVLFDIAKLVVLVGAASTVAFTDGKFL
jgi:hypothetical protein